MAYAIRHLAMGSPWEVDIWDAHIPDRVTENVINYLDTFNATYSRFSDTSLIAKLSQQAGRHTVPTDFVNMMRMLMKLNDVSEGKINPLIGQSLSDAGYDKNYSLKERDTIAQTPLLSDVVKIIDDQTIELARPALIDLGAIGKGYAVDALVELLQGMGVQSCVVNGSGDMRHVGMSEFIVGLEHPDDATKVIGTTKLLNSAIASSGSNRRAWRSFHHILDPETNTSPEYIRASWVRARTATEADLIATALFLVPPEQLFGSYDFEYLLLNHELRVKKSVGWTGELF